MSTVTTEGTATPVAAAPDVRESTLAAEFGQLLGEHTPEPEPATPSEGTPPAAAEPVTETPAEVAKPEGEADAPPPSEESTSAAAADVVEDDPFKDSTDATYVVNGQSVAVPDIRVFKEGGAVIRPESLPNILSKLARLDTVEPRERELRTQHTTLSKAVEWTTPEGKTLTGPEAAIELRIGNATLFAENTLMAGVIQAEDLQPYLTTKTVMVNGEPKEVVIFKPEAISDLVRERDLQKRELTAKTRDYFKDELSKVAAPTAPMDYAVEAPRLIAAVAGEAKLDPNVLTTADKVLLVKQLPFHIKNGLASVEWQELVKDRIALRMQGKTLVDTTTKAVKDGQARMLAAARGVKPTTARPTTPPVKPKVPTPQQERMDNEDELFMATIAAGARAMREHR